MLGYYCMSEATGSIQEAIEIADMILSGGNRWTGPRRDGVNGEYGVRTRSYR